jgi:hypothetical protein
MFVDFLRTTVDWLSNENRFLLSSAVLLTVVAITSIALNSIGKKYLKNEVKDLQARLWYSDSDVHRVISQYKSTNGIDIYIISLITLDLVLPIAYSLLFSIILTVEFTYFKSNSNFYIPRDIRLLPLFLMTVDWSENIAIIILTRQYPNLKLASVKVASALTTAKWTGISSFVILIIIIMIVNKM